MIATVRPALMAAGYIPSCFRDSLARRTCPACNECKATLRTTTRDPARGSLSGQQTLREDLRIWCETAVDVQVPRASVRCEHADSQLRRASLSRERLRLPQKQFPDAWAAVRGQNNQVGYQTVRSRRVVQLREWLGRENGDEADDLSVIHRHECPTVRLSTSRQDPSPVGIGHV